MSSTTLSRCLIVAFSIGTIQAQDCDFDAAIYPLCGWTLGIQNNGPQWILDRTDSPLPNGPTSDHTNPGVGHFVYMDPTLGEWGISATLTSPILSIDSDIDFKFWYHMHGVGIGTLNVYVQGSDVDGKMDLVFTLSGDQGNAWNEASIRISTPLDSRIVVEGVKGYGITDGIALDDVLVTNTSSTGNVSCDFEADDICGYRQVLPDDFDWVRRSGGTPTEGTGPPSDHTFSNSSHGGFYMYTEASSYSEGDAARMSTPAVGPSPAMCLSFWYYMYGDSSERSVGPLHVYKTDVDSNVLTYSLLSLHGSQGNKWVEMRIDFRSNQAFQIVFEGTRGGSYRSDIAIDDVTIVRHSWCNGSTVPTISSHLPTRSESATPRSFNPKFTPISTSQLSTSSHTNRTKLHNNPGWHMSPHFVTVVVAAGLSFWAVVFCLIFISMYRSHRLRKKELCYQFDSLKFHPSHQHQDEQQATRDSEVDTDVDPVDDDVDIDKAEAVVGTEFLPSILKCKLMFAMGNNIPVAEDQAMETGVRTFTEIDLSAHEDNDVTSRPIDDA